MEQFISLSNKPLVFDAIPAVKVSHYAADGLPIYTYARLYALKKDIILNLCSFERDPQENSAIEFLFYNNETEKQLVVTITPQKAICEIVEENKKGTPLELEEPSRFAGEDEQGWYWGANITVPQKYLEEIGIQVKAGQHFTGAVVKRWLKQNGQEKGQAMGCSSPLSRTDEIMKDKFDQFSIVKY